LKPRKTGALSWPGRFAQLARLAVRVVSEAFSAAQRYDDSVETKLEKSL
jgi:hypothetical protein